MKLQDILEIKGRRVHTIRPEATLADVVESLVRHNCGSLVVCDGDQMVGIITERDILRACATQRDGLHDRHVRDHMTPNPITARPGSDVEDIMGILTENRIRHLPITEHNRLIGIISIGDVVKAQHDALSLENHFLKSYIHG